MKVQLVLAVLYTSGEGKGRQPEESSWILVLLLSALFKSVFSLRNAHLSLDSGGVPDSVSLHLFVIISLLNEPLMSCCPSQMDEKLFCYKYSSSIACTVQGEEKNSPLGTFYLLKKQLQGKRTAENSNYSLFWQSSPCLGAVVHSYTKGIVICKNNVIFLTPEKKHLLQNRYYTHI